MTNSDSAPAGVRGSELEALHALVGTWASEGETVPRSSEPSIEIKGSDRYEWLGSGFIVHWVDVMMGDDHVEVVELIGEYDRESRTYAMRSFDGEGGTALMRASVNADGVWTFAGDTARATLSIADDRNTMGALWERSDDGSAWTHWMDMRFTKQ